MNEIKNMMHDQIFEYFTKCYNDLKNVFDRKFRTYHYIVLQNKDRSILFSIEENYIGCEIRYNHLVIMLKNLEGAIEEVQIDTKTPEDLGNIMGFETYEAAQQYMSSTTEIVCNQPGGKVIISPQLANFLLDRGCQIIHLKLSRESEDKTVFVFKSTPLLYDALDCYKKEKK